MLEANSSFMSQAPQDEANGACHYCYISDVEDAGSKATKANVYKIDYVATIRYTVDQVTEPTARNERKSNCRGVWHRRDEQKIA